MNYYLFKLRFDTAVHFGGSDSALSLTSTENHFCADTLFSALCHSAVSLYGSSAADALCDAVRENELVLSDGMPWKGDSLYIPKPCVLSEQETEIDESIRKKMKRLAWIDIASIEAFTNSIHGNQIYQPQDDTFGAYEEHTKVRIDNEVALPYQIGVFRFYDQCGLYFVAGCENNALYERLVKLLTGLGLSGFGGRTSTGYGRFSILEIIDLQKAANSSYAWFKNALTATAKRYVLLSSSLPNEAEMEAVLDGASYQIVRRGGFAQLTTTQTFKKKEQYFLAAGSVVKTRFAGALYPVGAYESDKVFRYSVPILLGVDL